MHGERNFSEPTCFGIAGNLNDVLSGPPSPVHSENVPSGRMFTDGNTNALTESLASAGKVTVHFGNILLCCPSLFSPSVLFAVLTLCQICLLVIAAVESSVAPSPTAPAAVLEHVAEAIKKAGLNAAAVAFIPNTPCPQAQTGHYAAAAHAAVQPLPGAEPSDFPDTIKPVAETRFGGGANMKVKLRLKAAVYTPQVKSGSPRISARVRHFLH